MRPPPFRFQGGASLDTRVLCGDGRESTWLCAGSTALHLASARGSVAIALALLEAQASRPGERFSSVGSLSGPFKKTRNEALHSETLPYLRW